VEISGFQAGESIAVFGAGPVGLMAAYSAALRGASNIYVVDRVPERLEAARNIGAIPIDFTKGDAVDQIISHNGDMVDRSVDAVGYQAVDSNGSAEKANIVLENMIRVTRACGGMGIPGLYVPRYVKKDLLFLRTYLTIV
jgi:threonine dehydrogenase-like Zn-dependent dehydrogenase